LLALPLSALAPAAATAADPAAKPSTPAKAAAETPAPPAGTYIHVKNGTNLSLKFCLYVECAGAGTGKFDKEFQLKPGEVGIWRLGQNYRVATSQHNGSKLYRLGLIGTDVHGLQHRWGTLGGHGMVGNEQQKPAPDQPATSGTPVSYRHILVRPAGDF
jgi:hypothetical protein